MGAPFTLEVMDLMTAVEVIRAPLSETQPLLSAALAEAIPHRTLSQLSANCPFAPFKTHGESPGAPGSSVTIADLAALRPLVPARGTWQGRATMAGVEVPVLALASDVTEQGALLVLVRTEDTPVPEEHLAPALALWDLVTAHREGLRTEAAPGWLAVSRAAAAARAVAIAELGDAHGAALAALLGVLRDRGLDDRPPGRAPSTSPSPPCRAALGGRTRPGVGGGASRGGVRAARRVAAPDPARPRRAARSRHAGRGGGRGPAAARRCHQHGACSGPGRRARVTGGPGARARGRVSRIHVGWKVGCELRATVRDDGPGTLSRGALDARRVRERLGPLGGRLEVDAVPGWGTTVTIEVPLAPPDGPRQDPLTALGARELEVLGHLARGRRNRHIAHELHISESTVKFHVANILDKLGVGSRGEAAALAHEWGAAPRAPSLTQHLVQRDRQTGTRLYDIPAHAVASSPPLFADHCREHGHDASLRAFEQRSPHRERVRHAVARTGAGIPRHGRSGASGDRGAGRPGLRVTRGPRQRARLAVHADRVQCRAGSRLMGLFWETRVSTTHGSSSPSADALNSWRHLRPLDGLADLVLLGCATRRQVAAKFGAPPARRLGRSGVRVGGPAGRGGIPATGWLSKRRRNEPGGPKFALDFRPRSLAGR